MQLKGSKAHENLNFPFNAILYWEELRRTISKGRRR